MKYALVIQCLSGVATADNVVHFHPTEEKFEADVRDQVKMFCEDHDLIKYEEVADNVVNALKAAMKSRGHATDEIDLAAWFREAVDNDIDHHVPDEENIILIAIRM